MSIQSLKLSGRRIWMHKGIKHVEFGSESVLSNDAWSFVELWLKRNQQTEALSLWIQARRFADSTKTLRVEAAPLTAYYSMLNAAKALLSVCKQSHNNRHGVSGESIPEARSALSNELVTFKGSGVLSAFCSYLEDSSTSEQYSLKDLLWNLPFLHRAFRHTYSNSTELFIPIEQARYVKQENGSKAWFTAQIVPRYSDKRKLKNIPTSMSIYESEGKTIINRKKRFDWCNTRSSSDQKTQAVGKLRNYHSQVRRVIVPITGVSALWYLKKSVPNNPVAQRHTLAIIYAAMHRLSELARYDPNGWERHLSGKANWLLTEFVEHAIDQFIDQIASEITGLEFWQPGVRTGVRS
jgi:hypothetical protein